MNSPVGDKQWLCTFEDTCVSFDNLRSLNKHSPSRDKEIIQRYWGIIEPYEGMIELFWGIV